MASLVLDRTLRILDQLSRYDTRGLTPSDLRWAMRAAAAA